MKTIFFSVFLIIQTTYLSGQFKNVLIDNQGSPNEPSIAINQKNPSQIVAGSNIDNFYFSSDTGKTWTKGKLKSDFGVWGDPVILTDTNGHFYFFHLSNADAWIDRIVAQKSFDGGKTWPQDTYMGHLAGNNQDKHWAVTDPRNNIIYCTWTHFDKYGSNNPKDSSHILFSRSLDAGKTWSPAKRIDQNGGDCIDDDNTTEGAVPAVGPNGEIYVSWAGPLGLVFDRSLDEGETWLNKDIIVSDFPGGWNYEIPGIYRCNGLPVTVCDLSQGQYRGTIYINWTDQRNGENDTDVWIVKSTDNGNTWSDPVRVNNDLPGKQQFFTWMAIDQATGYLYFVFYDRRNHTDNKTDVFMAISRDGGETFENFKISESPFYPNKNAFFGDYTNISVHNNIVRPIWARMENYNMSIWTALINGKKITTSISDLQFEDHFFELYDNDPNPYKGKTAISFKLYQPAVVTLDIYNSLGFKISGYINNKFYNSGKHIIVIDVDELNLKSGIYYYTLKVENKIKTKKMIIQ